MIFKLISFIILGCPKKNFVFFNKKKSNYKSLLKTYQISKLIHYMFDGLQPSFREFLNSLQIPILLFGREKLQAGNFHILNISEASTTKKMCHRSEKVHLVS